MTQSVRRWFGASLLLCTLLIACLVYLDRTRARHPVRPGEPLPTLSVVALDGTTVQLRGNRSGTVVYNVFATWCPPCREETPALARTATLLRKRGIRFVGIDQGEGSGAVSAFANTFRIGYPIVLDEKHLTNTLLGARVIPETIVVHDGIVRSISVGPLDADALTRLVEQSERRSHA